jgi:sterol desaturase/sphingolipid hydroxylase (fatty acid hydroxylase superfamily)
VDGIEFGGIAAGLAGWIGSGPATLVASGLATWVVLLRTAASTLAIALAAVALCTAIELFAPAERGQGARGRIRNLGHLAVFQILGLAAIVPWILYGPAPSPAAPAAGPVEAGLLILAHLLAIDFVYYWYHRAQHRFRTLWAIHELHHADAELNATSSFRTYWLELPVQAVLVVSPAMLLFGDRGSVHALGVLIGSYAFLIFSHCNFRLALGPLSLLLCGPQVHRIHHSRLPEHRDRNFAQYFPFLDRFFGTWYAPSPAEFPPTGVDGLASDASFAQVWMRPFRSARAGLAGGEASARSSTRTTRESRARRRPRR